MEFTKHNLYFLKKGTIQLGSLHPLKEDTWFVRSIIYCVTSHEVLDYSTHPFYSEDEATSFLLLQQSSLEV